MGQKVHPYGFRLGFNKTWRSRWYSDRDYAKLLHEDLALRAELKRRFAHAGVSRIEIERAANKLKIDIHTSRPGIIIGRKGAEVDKLRASLEDLTNRRVSINIIEVKNPDLDAHLVAEGISEQLKRRASFRRTMKQRAESVMSAGAKGVKIIVSGRLGGAEMSRSEALVVGSVPLHTLEANVEYGTATSFTTYGAVGVKVWIYHGMFGEEVQEDPNAGLRTRAGRRREGGPRGAGGTGPGETPRTPR